MNGPPWTFNILTHVIHVFAHTSRPGTPHHFTAWLIEEPTIAARWRAAVDGTETTIDLDALIQHERSVVQAEENVTRCGFSYV